MQKQIYTFLVVFLFATMILSCSAWKETNTIKEEKIYSPCTDSLYMVLKNKNIDSLSIREYQYFISLDNQCKEYTQNKKTNNSTEYTVAILSGIVTIIVAYLIWGKQIWGK